MKHRLLLLISLVGLVTYGGTAAASAESAAPHGLTSQSPYCVARATPTGSTARPTMTCYSTFAASIRAATGGRVRLPASAKPASITPDELNAAGAVPATIYVLSIDYAYANFGPPSLAWEQSSKCGSFQASSMPTGWNDVVSSVITESGCANTL
jgi:hypothetical protein